VREVDRKIRAVIADRGVIPFSEFMALALYCPNYGYYEVEKDRIGRQGDFYTSVSVGPLFGELLARQFADWAAEQKSGTRFRLVEAGAHDGQLASDILSWLQRSESDLFTRMTYIVVEPSVRRQSWQCEKLAAFKSTVTWVSSLQELEPDASATTIIFSNELLDAFPVRRFGWDATKQQWIEKGVALNTGSGFMWRDLPRAAATSALPSIPHEVMRVLPDGFLLDLCPAATKWWREAAEKLGHGWLLTLDYGLGEDEIIRPERAKGTLRAYHHHHRTTDLLAYPGEQDLTAHVDFDALKRAGESAGLATDFFGNQSSFLTRILSKSSPQPNLTPAEIRQFKTLTHPEHLGRAFRVLAQRGAGKD
jgi:SAM-dependent MidA family methyltransferase